MLLGMKEWAFLFASWIALVLGGPRAYALTNHVTAQINMVHRVALDIGNWHWTMPILSPAPRQRGNWASRGGGLCRLDS